jgi:lantibiotic modifying enzyme
MENTILEKIELELANSYSKNNDLCSLNDRLAYVLFLSYYYFLEKNDSIKDKIYPHLETCIEYYSENPSDSTLFNGFTGLGWLMQHLYNLEILSLEDIESLEDLDEFVEQSLERDFQTQNMDFIYGMIGKATYFFERHPTVDCTKQLTKIFKYYSNLSNQEHPTNAAYAERKKEDDRDYSVNLGLAHGVPNVIVFLSKLYQIGICKEEVYKELEKLVSWFLKQKLKDTNDLGTFSTTTEETATHLGRLAWCYGDLGIVTALQHAQNVLKRESLEKEILQILKKSTKRKLETSGVFTQNNKVDNNICHGVAGVAHIYYNFSKLYENIEIQDAYEYWYTMLLKNTDANKEFLNCYSYQGAKKDIWTKEATLINGLAGIGLVLLSQEDKIKKLPCTWDTIFLMDIS